MGAGPALGRGVKRLLSFSPREFSRKASLSRLRKPGSLKATAEPSPAPRHCCQELASPSALGSLGGRGQPPQGQLWVEGLPGRGHCWGAERQVPRASTLDTACPHCHPTEGPRWQGVPLKPDSPGRRGLMPWDRCGDRAGMRQAFHIRLAGQGDPPPMKNRPFSTQSPRHVGNVPPSNSSRHQSPPCPFPKTSGLSLGEESGCCSGSTHHSSERVAPQRNV